LVLICINTFVSGFSYVVSIENQLSEKLFEVFSCDLMVRDFRVDYCCFIQIQAERHGFTEVSKKN